MTNESLLLAFKVLFAAVVIALVVALVLIRTTCAGVWRLYRQ